MLKVFSVIVVFCAFTFISLASNGNEMVVPEELKSTIPPPQLNATSWILRDQKSGWTIASDNAELRIEPASLSKLMTAFIVFEEMHNGNLLETDLVRISEKAWKTEGSRMFVKVNSKVSVEDLIKGLIVQSGNDAAVALAEHIAGSEEGFSELMNQSAKKLGLNGSQFRNSTGLPHEEHFSTARDLTELTRVLIDRFPEKYQLYSIKSFTYNKINQPNRNLLLWRDDAVDGVKTGHTKSAGYCLVGSAEKQGMRLIATVMGTDSKNYRAEAVHKLLNYGFAAYEGFLLYQKDQKVASADVYKGDISSVDAHLRNPLYVTVAKGRAKQMGASVELSTPLVAPIDENQTIGRLSLKFEGNEIGEYPLVPSKAVLAGGWFTNMFDSVRLLVQ